MAHIHMETGRHVRMIKWYMSYCESSSATMQLGPPGVDEQGKSSSHRCTLFTMDIGNYLIYLNELRNDGTRYLSM